MHHRAENTVTMKVLVPSRLIHRMTVSWTISPKDNGGIDAEALGPVGKKAQLDKEERVHRIVKGGV